MKIEDNGGNELTITGNIKSIEDSMEIKKAITTLLKREAKSIVVKIVDSFSMTSTVIGHMMKVVNLDKVPISLVVGDQRLYLLFEDLSLLQAFKVRLSGR